MKMKAGLGNQEYKWVEDFRRTVKVKSVEKLTECWWLHLLLSPGSPHLITTNLFILFCCKVRCQRGRITWCVEKVCIQRTKL